MNKQESNASLTVLDISRGYSVLKVRDKTLYFKHPSNVHFLKSEEYYIDRLHTAVRRGIKTEAQLLETFIKRGLWTNLKEEKIKSLQWTIGKSELALTKITDQTQKDVFQNSISGQQQELKNLASEREKLVGQNAEAWASQQRMIEMARNHVFKDKLCSKPYDFKEDFEVILAIQIKMNELSTKNNLLAAVYEPSFFDIFSLQYRNPLSVFNCDFFTITIFQRYLLSHASVVLNKLKNLDIPSEIREDPVKVYDFNPDQKSHAKKVTHGVDDLKASIRQKGKLTPEDLVQ